MTDKEAAGVYFNTTEDYVQAQILRVRVKTILCIAFLGLFPYFMTVATRNDFHVFRHIVLLSIVMWGHLIYALYKLGSIESETIKS